MRLLQLDKLGMTVLFYCGWVIILFSAYVLYQFRFKEEEKNKKITVLPMIKFRAATMLGITPDKQQQKRRSAMQLTSPMKDLEMIANSWQAIEDYEAQHRVEMSFVSGDVIQVTDSLDAFLVGELNGRKALFPREKFRPCEMD